MFTCADVWRQLTDIEKNTARDVWLEYIKNDPLDTIASSTNIPDANTFFSERIETRIKKGVEIYRNRLTYEVHLVKQEYMKNLMQPKVIWVNAPIVANIIADVANDAAIEYFACLIKLHETGSIDKVQLALQAEAFLSDVCYPTCQEVFYTHAYENIVEPHEDYVMSLEFATQATVTEPETTNDVHEQQYWQIASNIGVVFRRYCHFAYMVTYLSSTRKFRDNMLGCPSVPPLTSSFVLNMLQSKNSLQKIKSVLQTILNFILRDDDLRKSLTVCRFFYSKIPFYTSENDLM